MSRVYSRRSSRKSADDESRSVTNVRRSSRRARDVQDGGEEEEQVEPLSKRGKRQSSRHRLNGVAEEVEEEEQDAEMDEEEVEDQNAGPETDGGLWGVAPIKKMKVSPSAQKAAEAIGAEEIKRQANDLARMALFYEQRRTVLKREDITKKVLDKASAKAFPVIFNRAQKVLSYTFGFEMVELRLKGTDNEQLTQAPAGQEEEARAIVKSKTYIIRSVLPSKVIARMAAQNDILKEVVRDVNEADIGGKLDNVGVMVDWKRSSGELGNMGLLYLILSLILLNGRVMNDDQLQSYLRRMSLDPRSVLPDALQPDDIVGNGPDGKLTMDDYLDVLIKQSYLECNRSGSAPQGTMSMDGATLGKRTQVKSRKSNRNDEGQIRGHDHEWRWGARAELEITEKAIGEFVAEVYIKSEEGQGSDVGEDDNDEIQDGNTGRSKNTRKTILQHVEHAAGSQLIS